MLHKISHKLFEKEANMITTLTIKNIGIIDDLSINLNKGFNVLTGETGARKNFNNRCTKYIVWW